MTLHTALSLLILSFITPSHALTKYVGDNVTITVESVQPCHLFGDADLFGKGVRASFYTSWAAGVIGILFGAARESKSPRLSFNILLFTLLIILIRNANRGSFALLEWYIVTGLAILSFNVFLMTVPVDFVSFDLDDDDDSSTADEEEGRQPRDETNTQGERANEDDSQSAHKTTRELEDETRQKEAEKRVGRSFLAGYYSDPIGFGFLFLLYATLTCCLPWLHFTKGNSGHKEGCPVPIVLFGTWDMYNTHWRGFQKATAVMAVIFTFIMIPLGSYMIYRGAIKWQMYDLTVELMRKRRYSGIQLLRLNLDNIRQDLDAGQPGNLTVEQVRERADAIERLGGILHRAQLEEQDAAMSEEQVRELMTRVSKLVDDQKGKRIASWIVRGILAFSVALGGGLSIWFIEKTIQKNEIDMEDKIGSNTGQLLALLVSVFTTVSFLWELYKSWKERRDARKKAEEIAGHIRLTAMDLHFRATDQRNIWRWVADHTTSLLSQLQNTAPAPAPAPAPPETAQTQRGSFLSSIFSRAPTTQAAGRV